MDLLIELFSVDGVHPWIVLASFTLSFYFILFNMWGVLVVIIANN